jgi:hypothetical protein
MILNIEMDAYNKLNKLLNLLSLKYKRYLSIIIK